jgi:signal transduction histidine kinase
MTDLDYRLLFERAPGRFLVLAVDEPRYTIRSATDAYLDATLTTREIAGRPLFDVFPDNPAEPDPTGVQNLDDSLRHVLASREPRTMAVQKYDIRDRSGSFVERFWTPVNAPVLSSDGALRYLVHRVEDVTEFVQRGEMLEQEAARLESEILLHSRELAAANKALAEEVAARERLLAIVGHDFRSPLATVQMAAAALTRHFTALNARPPRLLHNIQSSVLRMDAMLHDLFDFTTTRLGGSLSIARERVDARAICEAAVEEVRLTNPRRVVELEEGVSIAVEVDAARVHQALINLLENALTYGAVDRPVRLSLGRSAGFCVLTVVNEGEPIPEELIPTLFQAFRRGSHPRGQRNIGLGLYIVQQIALAHGGGVEVHSSPRDGTRFSIRLPCKA